METTDVLRVGDVELFVRQLGERRDDTTSLVVLHGGPSWDHSYLLPGLRPVAETRHVVLFDMRGCGRSSRDLPSGAYQPEHVVADTDRLVETLRLGQVDLLGFSTGGQVAQLSAEAHPDRLRRLVLASTTAYPEVAQYLDGWAEYERRMSAPAPPTGDLDDLETTVLWAKASAATAIWDLDLLPAYLELLDQVRFSGDWLAPFLSGRLHAWRPADPVGVLRELKKPILILHAAQDMCFPVQVAQRLHQAVPTAELVVLEQAGHMAHFERPQQWATAVIEFLARV